MNIVRLCTFSIIVAFYLNAVPLLHASEPKLHVHFSFADQKATLLYAAHYCIAPIAAIIGIAWGIRHFFYSANQNIVPEEEIEKDTLDFIILLNNYHALSNAASVPELHDIKDQIKSSTYYELNIILEEKEIKNALENKTHTTKYLDDMKADVVIRNGIFTALNLHKKHDIISAPPEDLEALNLFWKAKQRYINMHEFLKNEPTNNSVRQAVLWESTFFEKVFKKLDADACSGALKGKDYCIRNVKCHAAAITAAYKEYQYQKNNNWQHLLNKEHITESVDCKEKTLAQAFKKMQETLTPLCTFEDIEQLVATKI